MNMYVSNLSFHTTDEDLKVYLQNLVLYLRLK